ncbi:Flavinator of succinate dehydrogenase-domain-containing protein [Apodospora peruviana]|uniref:Succinate dehydrogenase assembly factor 2, mitochondrial n=1 Tax=Apodospora peruviana TaxID=516989 RepID=A0AAE0II91_9PEZI|nr:Flavinator of succinate dehydrogenase-domain-containing protein [Apodospora peruviana]
MASPLHAILRPAAAAIRRSSAQLLRQVVRPMATASRHVSLSGYIVPRSQSSNSNSNSNNGELEVGELEGAKFKVEPLRRVGEDSATMRARLLYQSRKRGTLESDLLLSTFAAEHLSQMTPEQLRQYDLFLDENDWDIYYWATQEPPTGQNADHEVQQDTTDKKDTLPPPSSPPPSPRAGEWAQTVGTFKPAYRPVPARWADSEILKLLKEHVKTRGAVGKGGMAFMPSLEESR